MWLKACGATKMARSCKEGTGANRIRRSQVWISVPAKIFPFKISQSLNNIFTQNRFLWVVLLDCTFALRERDRRWAQWIQDPGGGGQAFLKRWHLILFSAKMTRLWHQFSRKKILYHGRQGWWQLATVPDFPIICFSKIIWNLWWHQRGLKTGLNWEGTSLVLSSRASQEQDADNWVVSS